ncbi:hypothetical protein FQR65_LT17365 [Abscondita terminalis]|nr:hypothetical protein FQR65_LT17365 [Abscondita terminalis]
MNTEDFSVPADEDLFEHYRFEAGKGQQPLRVDKFLMNLVENATRNKIQQAAANGNIFVNDVPVKSNHKVKSNDVVRVLMEQPPFENVIIPENIPLKYYEDDDLLVINNQQDWLYILRDMIQDPVKWKSKIEKISDTEYMITLDGTIEKGWHMYSQFTPEGGAYQQSLNSIIYRVTMKLLKKTMKANNKQQSFEIMLPNSWANKVDRQADRGGLIGIFFMALALAVVSFSCTGPIVGTLLVEAAAKGGIAPIIGMFGFSLALALPFMLFAMFPGWLNFLCSVRVDG